MKLAIVAIGYNRIDPLKRLLASLENAEYMDEDVALIISLDYWEDDTLRSYANDFVWSHGKKVLRFYEEKQGLRAHVLQCGNYLNEYDFDAVSVFEDDIVPSPFFYSYMKDAIGFYKNYDEIAGIALYSFGINPCGRRPFCPSQGGTDTYLMQFPCSWGQIWTRKQWNGFYAWYNRNKDAGIKSINVPENVSDWPETSWLKYYVKYCISQKKFFVYPYVSLTTNFNEQGTHVKKTETIFQVAMQEQLRKKYDFCEITNAICYDAFFERIGVGGAVGIEEKDLCTDLYGNKKRHMRKRFWLTTRASNFKIIGTYALSMKPHEENVLHKNDGEGIYLYDTSVYQRNNLEDNERFLYPFDCRGKEYPREVIRNLPDSEFVSLMKSEILLRCKDAYRRRGNGREAAHSIWRRICRKIMDGKAWR